MNVSMPLTLRTLSGLHLTMDHVSDDTSIREILDFSKHLLLEKFPESNEAQRILEGREIGIVGKGSRLLSLTDTIGDLKKSGFVKGPQDSFFYKSTIVVLNQNLERKSHDA